MSERDEEQRLDESIGNLWAESPAPAHLRSRIVAELRERGAIATSPWKRRTWAAVAAALAVGATLGIFRVLEPRDSTEGDARVYVLILDTVAESYSQMSPEEAAPLAAAYTRWIEEIETRGRLRESFYLASTASTEGLDAVSGIVVLEAGSREEVEAIVEMSPHLRRGGTIRIRELARAR